jgi:glutamine amidotransferase
MFSNIDDSAKFYFAHSYHFELENQTIINSIATYSYQFPASFILNNIWGTQFHPEKSHDNGILSIKKFLTYA